MTNKLSIILIAVVLSGCSATPQTIPAQTLPQSNLVFYPEYTYQGVSVAPSKNWMYGRGEGINGKIIPNNQYGYYFQHAKRVQSEEASIPSSVSPSAVEATAICSVENKDENKEIMGEWLVHFDSNQTIPLDFGSIESELLEIDPIEVSITGYTDDIGSDLYNQKLSKRRAEEIASRVNSIWSNIPINVGWSGECPKLVLNTDSESRSKNRRVRIVAYKEWDE